MYRNILGKDEYSFLQDNKHLGSNIQLLALGGSHAYGLNVEGSDLDVRGMAINSKSEILLGEDFNQVQDKVTDTVIYSSNKLLKMLSDCNPNVIEMLGCKPEHYLYVGGVGKLILDNKKLFLSKLCIKSFSDFASDQLRRLEAKSDKVLSQTDLEAHILKSIEKTKSHFNERYSPLENESLELFIDRSEREDMDSEIFMNVNLHNYPLRDWVNMWNDMKSVVRVYNKFGKKKEIELPFEKLCKHMCHTLRLYIMCIDILEKEEVITFRDEEHDLLMRVRNGDFLDLNSQPTSEFYDILNDYKKRFDYAKDNTSLPDLPNRKRIEELRLYINEGIVKGEF